MSCAGPVNLVLSISCLKISLLVSHMSMPRQGHLEVVYYVSA